MKRTGQAVLVLFVLMMFMAIGVDLAQAQSQAAAADLIGVVKDESGALISGATVTVRNPQTNFERVTTTDLEGNFKLLALPPSQYELLISAEGFKTSNAMIELVLGTTAILNINLLLPNSQLDIIEVKAQFVETTRSALTQGIEGQRIESLPINGRNFLGFAFINSLIGRDNSPPIGPAPTTGLNFGGQRARSNLVQVDGSDNIDNSVKGARSTISQEAVQEFQLIINSFAAEFGRTAGGVINIVTKSGTNELHGNAFGFIRHRSIQARNALAFQPVGANPKPAYTRGQYGFTLGGAIKRDKAFFFLSLDQTRRHESGFSQIGLDPSIFELTAAQQAFIAGNPAGAVYGALARSGAQVARTGIDPNTGRPVFYSTFLASNGRLGAIPASFKTLSNIENVYPISDEFTFYSVRLDYQLNNNNRISGRYTYTPVTTTGIQSSSQNQPFGLNDRSRTGISVFRDTALVLQDLHTFGAARINEFLFNFGRRGTGFTSSPDVALNVSGAAFFGSEPFSPVDRIEKNYQFKDNLTNVVGNHTIKLGGDVTYVRITPFRFDLNFPGVFNFGDIAAGGLSPALAAAPAFTTVQAYGLGLPQTFIQGFGQTSSKVVNKVFGLFIQDSWKIRPNLTLNYGVRYDIELTPVFRPQSVTTDQLSLTAAQLDAAERFLNVTENIPRDKNNFSPRVAIAWDPKGNGRTVIRAAYGIFFDHPLLTLALNADIIDGAQSPQFIALGGSPLPNNPVNAAQIFQGTIIPGVTPGIDRGALYLPGQSRFDPSKAAPGFGVILPFTLPIDRDFVYAYSNQVNLTIERELTSNLAASVSYIFTGTRKLPHSVNRNAPDGKRILQAGGINAVTIANNFFRPSGPNPVFIKTSLPIPFGMVGVQESSSSAVYHGLSLNLTRRFSGNFLLQASYSFTKNIDDSTDLQTLLQPQDNNHPELERSLSLLHQRHRFVLSGVFTSPYKQATATGVKKLLANFTFSSIIEFSSGKPFNILTGSDTNLDLTPSTDRPNIDAATGALTLPRLGEIGTLGRNAGITPGFANVDMRLTRNLPVGERCKIDFIVEVFNLFNRVNVATVNNNFRLITFRNGEFKSPPTSVFDPRQFQLALKISF